MKNNKLQLMLAGLFLCAAAMPAFAEENTREEKKLETSSGELEKSATQPEGQQRVINKIKTEFAVDDARVQGLRDRKLGYGEISIALGLAQGLPGGITDENVQKVVALRQGPPVMGWGKIARELGLKLGPVQSKIHKMFGKVLKQEKSDKVAKDKKDEKMVRPEMPGKPEKMERMGKHEMGGKH